MNNNHTSKKGIAQRMESQSVILSIQSEGSRWWWGAGGVTGTTGGHFYEHFELVPHEEVHKSETTSDIYKILHEVVNKPFLIKTEEIKMKEKKKQDVLHSFVHWNISDLCPSTHDAKIDLLSSSEFSC